MICVVYWLDEVMVVWVCDIFVVVEGEWGVFCF